MSSGVKKQKQTVQIGFANHLLDTKIVYKS